MYGVHASQSHSANVDHQPNSARAPNHPKPLVACVYYPAGPRLPRLQLRVRCTRVLWMRNMCSLSHTRTVSGGVLTQAVGACARDRQVRTPCMCFHRTAGEHQRKCRKSLRQQAIMAPLSLVALLAGPVALAGASDSSMMAWPLRLWYTEEMGAVRQCVLDIRSRGNCTVTLRLDAVWACANAYSDEIRDLASYCHSRCSDLPGVDCKRLWASGGDATGDEIKPYLNLAHASGICCCCPDAVSKVEISLMAAGEVADYDQAARTALINAMAAALGVSPAAITLSITAASVNLLFTVAVEDEKEANAVVRTVSTSLGTTAQANNVLNAKLRLQRSVAVVSLQLINAPQAAARKDRETVAPPPSPPPPAAPPSPLPPPFLPPPPDRYLSGIQGSCCGAYGTLTSPASARASLEACMSACDAEPTCTSIAYTSEISGCLAGAGSPPPSAGTETVPCPLYSGTRPGGPFPSSQERWKEALWWARGHGLPTVTLVAPWMLTVTFTVTEAQRKMTNGQMVLLSLTGLNRLPNQPFDTTSGDWQIYFDNQEWSGQAGVSPYGVGALGMRRHQGGVWRTWDYSCTGTGVTCPGTPPQLTDGLPHTVTIHSTPWASDDAIKLYVDGLQVATSDSGANFPNMVSTARAQDLHGTQSTQCAATGQKRWIDETTLTEGVVACDTSSDQAMRDCGPSTLASAADSGFWCTYDLTLTTFRGEVHMLHLENDVTEADPYAKCRPCQPVCLMSSTCVPTGFNAGYCGSHGAYFLNGPPPPPPPPSLPPSPPPSPPPILCDDSCGYSSDNFCDDGGPGSSFGVCDLGTDCADCGPRSGGSSGGDSSGGDSSGGDTSGGGSSGGCSDGCQDSNDGSCDDGGPGSEWGICDLGTDCADCGPRSGDSSGGGSSGGGSSGGCSDGCQYSSDNWCDDGGPGSSFGLCDLGTDCADCGPR